VIFAGDGMPEFIPPQHLDPLQRPRHTILHRRTWSSWGIMVRWTPTFPCGRWRSRMYSRSRRRSPNSVRIDDDACLMYTRDL